MRCNRKVGASGAIVVRRDAALALPDWEIPTPTPGTWTGAREHGITAICPPWKQTSKRPFILLYVIFL